MGCQMEPIEWLKRFLFTRTRNTIPDGRPLYAYKCKQKDYNYLKQVVTREFERNLLPRYSLTFPLFFCLYAAETWRRNHVGGPWKWEREHPQFLDENWIKRRNLSSKNHNLLKLI